MNFQTWGLLRSKFRRSDCGYQRRSLDQRMNKSFLPPAQSCPDGVSGHLLRCLSQYLGSCLKSNLGSVSPRCFYCLTYWELPSSLYIRQRRCGLAGLAGPIVMIAAHRWRSNHDVSGVRWWLLGGYLGGSTASINIGDVSGDLVVSIVRVIFLIVGGNGSGE